MSKAYRRGFLNKQRIKYHGYNRYNPRISRQQRVSLYKRLMKQLLISIILVILIILFKSINTPVTNKTSLLVKQVLNYEVDLKEGLNKIKVYASYIKDYTDKITKSIPVFNDMEGYDFTLPLEGIIVSTYGEKYNPINEKISFQRGIDIQGMGINIVKSIDDGFVENIGESDTLGKFIKIKHSNNIFSIYSNLKEIKVSKNQSVKKGEEIGQIGDSHGSYLHFELWINDEAVDPKLYLDYSITNI